MQRNPGNLRFGPYLTPVVVVGTKVECEIRGLVTVVRLSDAPIPWPVGEQDGQLELIVYKALARAVRQERAQAVAEAWGVSLQTVQRWQAAARTPRKRKKQTRSSLPIPWKPDDDELLCSLSLSEAARLTGRTLTAVRKRRRMLGVPDGRLTTSKLLQRDAIGVRVATVRQASQQKREELRASMEALRLTCLRAGASLRYWSARTRQKTPS
jgi:hypothetical protein